MNGFHCGIMQHTRIINVCNTQIYFPWTVCKLYYPIVFDLLKFSSWELNQCYFDSSELGLELKLSRIRIKTGLLSRIRIRIKMGLLSRIRLEIKMGVLQY